MFQYYGYVLPEDTQLIMTSLLEYKIQTIPPIKLHSSPSAIEIANEKGGKGESAIELIWKIDECGSRNTIFIITVYKSPNNQYNSYEVAITVNTSTYDCFTSGPQYNYTFNSLMKNVYYDCKRSFNCNQCVVCFSWIAVKLYAFNIGALTITNFSSQLLHILCSRINTCEGFFHDFREAIWFVECNPSVIIHIARISVTQACESYAGGLKSLLTFWIAWIREN